VQDSFIPFSHAGCPALSENRELLLTCKRRAAAPDRPSPTRLSSMPSSPASTPSTTRSGFTPRSAASPLTTSITAADRRPVTPRAEQISQNQASKRSAPPAHRRRPPPLGKRGAIEPIAGRQARRRNQASRPPRSSLPTPTTSSATPHRVGLKTACLRQAASPRRRLPDMTLARTALTSSCVPMLVTMRRGGTVCSARTRSSPDRATIALPCRRSASASSS
jgi:hypothetical protein